MVASGIFIWFVAIFGIGFLGFFVVLIGLMIRFLSHVAKQAGKMLSSEEPAGESSAWLGSPGRRCTQVHCEHWNGPVARYCARCGRPLD